jgi:hypothetical protein
VTLLSTLFILAALLAATVLVAVTVRWREGRPSRHIAHEVVEPERLGAPSLGEEATLLQFSTESSERCPTAHRTLAEVAEGHPGVRHLDIDLTHRPDIARHFHVRQTPTTLVLDRNGVVQTRFGGCPSSSVVELELARLGVDDKTVAPEPESQLG